MVCAGPDQMDSSAEIATKPVGGSESLFYFLLGWGVQESLRVRKTPSASGGEIPCGIIGNHGLNEILNPALFFRGLLGRPLLLQPRQSHQEPRQQNSGEAELNGDRSGKSRSGAEKWLHAFM